MLRATQQVGQSGTYDQGSQLPASLGLLTKYLGTSGAPASCLEAQTPHHARASQMVLETDISHMITLSVFRRRRGRKEHSERSLCLAPMPENKTSTFAGAGTAQITVLGDVGLSQSCLMQGGDLGGIWRQGPLTGLSLPLTPGCGRVQRKSHL